MAEPHENPWPDEQHGGPPHPAANPNDLPADFFDEPSESAPAPPSEHAAAGFEPSALEPVAARERGAEPEALPAPPVDMGEDRRAPLFPMLLGALMLAAMITAVFLARQDSAGPASPAGAGTPAAAPTTPPPPSPADLLAGEVKKMESDVASLVTQLKDLQAKVAAIPKPEPAPDLKPIESKLEAFGKTLAGVSGLPEKLANIDTRMGGLDGALKSVSDKVGVLSDAVKKASAATPRPETATSTEPKPTADPAPAALGTGADLFKAGNYPQALETFRKAIDAGTKDARVYYYAALSRGLSTNDWRGESITLATSGSELEKAGTPKAADIDAAFAALPAKVKDWLDFYRHSPR